MRAAGSGRFGSARSSVARVRRVLFSLDKDLHGCRQADYPYKWKQSGCPLEICTDKSAVGNFSKSAVVNRKREVIWPVTF